MQSHKQAELAQIQRALLLIVMLDAVGTILVGLGLFVVFAAEGEAPGGLLESRDSAFYAIAVGAAIMLWSLIKIVSLLKRKARLMRASDS